MSQMSKFKVGDLVYLDTDYNLFVESVTNGIINISFHLKKEELEDDNVHEEPEQGYFFYSCLLIDQLIKRNNNSYTGALTYPYPRHSYSDLLLTTKGVRYHELEKNNSKIVFWINILIENKGIDILTTEGLYLQMPAYLHPLNKHIPNLKWGEKIEALSTDASLPNIRKIFKERDDGTKSVAQSFMNIAYSKIWSKYDTNNSLKQEQQEQKMLKLSLPSTSKMFPFMLMKGLSSKPKGHMNAALLWEKDAPYFVRLKSVYPVLDELQIRYIEDTFLDNGRVDSPYEETLLILKDSLCGKIIDIQDSYAWCQDTSDEGTLTCSYCLPLAVLVNGNV